LKQSFPLSQRHGGGFSNMVAQTSQENIENNFETKNLKMKL
jgi:hypothetical protein